MYVLSLFIRFVSPFPADPNIGMMSQEAFNSTSGFYIQLGFLTVFYVSLPLAVIP